MTLIDKAGLPAEDHWAYWEQGQLTEDRLSIVVPLDQWDTFTTASGVQASGVWMAASEHAANIVPVLGKVALIVIEFPKSRNGRGFTLARMLRERHHFAGDLRAAGPLLPDQFSVLLECGFSSLLASPRIPVLRWREAAASRAQSQSKPRTLLHRLSRDNQP